MSHEAYGVILHETVTLTTTLKINDAWETVTENIKTAKENLGYQKKKNNIRWFVDEC